MVSSHPVGRETLHVVHVFPVVQRQPFVAHAPVESLDIRIVLRFARLDGVKPDAILPGPFGDRRAQVFGPLSHRIAFGLPRQLMICCSARITRCDGNEKSISMPSASRLKSSIRCRLDSSASSRASGLCREAVTTHEIVSDALRGQCRCRACNDTKYPVEFQVPSVPAAPNSPEFAVAQSS